MGISGISNALRCSSASALIELLKTTDCLTILPPVVILPLIRFGSTRAPLLQGSQIT